MTMNRNTTIAIAAVAAAVAAILITLMFVLLGYSQENTNRQNECVANGGSYIKNTGCVQLGTEITK